jgi:glycerol-3-phosphate dehydrogenase
VERYARAYGTRIHHLLAGCAGMADMGRAITPQLYESELRYLASVEWAQTAEDVLWRRTKLGLCTLPEGAAAIARWMSGAHVHAA